LGLGFRVEGLDISKLINAPTHLDVASFEFHGNRRGLLVFVVENFPFPIKSGLNRPCNCRPLSPTTNNERAHYKVLSI
jgi:hypothetical protein